MPPAAGSLPGGATPAAPRAASGETAQQGAILDTRLDTDDPVTGVGEIIAADPDPAVERMNWGAISFNPPRQIRLGDVHQFQLVLSPTADRVDRGDPVPTAGSATRQTEPARFSGRMAARLASGGGGLEITAVTPEEQGVGGAAQIRWTWTVRGVEAGSHQLILTLDAILDDDGERLPRAIHSFSESIEVAATGPQRLAGQAVWIVLGVLVLAGAAILMARSRRREPVPAGAPPERAPPGYPRVEPSAPVPAVADHPVPAAPVVAAAPRAAESHPVFISHSAQDGGVAEAICGALERSGTRCWIAARDLVAVREREEAIADAIEGCSIVVVVLSSGANASGQVAEEVRRAVERGKAVIPFRIDAAPLSRSLRDHISAAHWISATQPPLEPHLLRLADTVRRLSGAAPANEVAAEPRGGSPSA
jgi:hypothetical protein